VSRRLTVLCLSLLLVGTTAAAAADLGLITGGAGGTYDHIGQDLKRLVKPRGIELTIHPSNGAVDNVYAVSRRPDVQLAIVQSDVLAFVAEQQSNPALAHLAQNLHLIFPLFDEEVHVLARRGVASFEDLAGKRVAIGREGSGMYVTARLLFKLAGIAPGELVTADGAAALALLKAGRIDALVSVMGQPAARFKNDVKPADGLALVPITTPAILERYEAAEIPPGTYNWQRTSVRTVAVRAMLVAFDEDRRHCDAIGRFAQQVAAGTDWLVKNGHPLWKRVDLQRPVKGLQPYDCVRSYADRPADAPAASTGERQHNPIEDAIEKALRNR
jgi:TRAP transporter TAXI family solute receptor